MDKYSKKLVSKCIYIQILKCTETELLGQFMAAGGWNLVHSWLRDGVTTSNWPFVQEILEMLLLCPVDGNRLKSNHTPKIVKDLSTKIIQNNNMVTALSKRLVEQWLKIAHQEKEKQNQNNGLNGLSSHNNNVNIEGQNLIVNNSVINQNEDMNTSQTFENAISEKNNDEDSRKSTENIKYKISNNKDSGLILSLKRSTSPNLDESLQSIDVNKTKSSPEHKSKSSSSERDREKDKERSKKSSSSSHKSSSSSKSSSSKSSSSIKSGSSSSSNSSRDKHSSSKSTKNSTSSSSSRDKEKEREKKKRDVEKEQAEKDKATLSFLTPLPSTKLQRIPKRQHSENSENKSDSNGVDSKKANEQIEKKKPSISIEVRKGDKPKTVKTLNSQFRNHGLAEEPPPPPSRKGLKKPAPPTNILPIIPTISTPSLTTRKSSTSPPPLKKIYLDKALSFEPDVPERAGGVKLIKPKREYLDSNKIYIFLFLIGCFKMDQNVISTLECEISVYLI